MDDIIFPAELVEVKEAIDQDCVFYQTVHINEESFDYGGEIEYILFENCRFKKSLQIADCHLTKTFFSKNNFSSLEIDTLTIKNCAFKSDLSCGSGESESQRSAQLPQRQTGGEEH